MTRGMTPELAACIINELRSELFLVESRRQDLFIELARTREERNLALRALGCGVGEYDAKIAELRAARDAPIPVVRAEWGEST